MSQFSTLALVGLLAFGTIGSTRSRAADDALTAPANSLLSRSQQTIGQQPPLEQISAQPKPANTSSAAIVLASVLPKVPPALSTDCRSKLSVSAKLATADKFRRPLRGLRRAVRAQRNPRVLVMGSSSTVGVGASRPAATYVARLEDDLEAAFTGVDFELFPRGMSGETAEGQSSRMQQTVAEVKPDLVLWQVGTNDALRHVDLASFKTCLRRTLAMLADSHIDVMLVDPQYGDKLAKDAYYEDVVKAIAEVAGEMRVLLVDRFEAMRQLSRENGDALYLASDQLHLNDTGHKCMAEQLARAIVAGVLQADLDSATELASKEAASKDSATITDSAAMDSAGK